MQCIFISALQILTDDLEMVDDFGQSLAADTFNDLGVKQSNTPYSNCLVEFLQRYSFIIMSLLSSFCLDGRPYKTNADKKSQGFS